MDPPPLHSLRDRTGGILATAAVLALLYFGRDVLVPVTLAVILSLAIAPLVRALRHVGFGQTLSVLTAVLVLTLACAAAAVGIGTQVLRMTVSLPQYEQTIRRKLAVLDEMTVGRLNAFSGRAGRLIDPEPVAAPAPASGDPVPAAAVESAPAAVPVVIRNPPASSLHVLRRVLGSIWVPLETTGIVLVVLLFVLLEREALRDRFIRIAGGTDIRASTLALNDAGERLSRFFVSQFLVNLGLACAVWLGLTLIGLPHALLWGALAGVLRFVPYVGVWIAALFATVLAAAVDPGWALAITTLGLFVVVEVVAGQLVEPQLYGHTTGLSPLAVVIAAIFWSGLWGPTGLIVSTPLTLCLVVAGRHVKALSLLDLLLGDTQALTLPQRLYQRALSGDSEEIIVAARAFLKRSSFAAYCDAVLLPALYLARLDLDTGAITAGQQDRVRNTMMAVITTLGGERVKMTRRGRESVLDHASLGRRLREQREQTSGPFQGPLTVLPGSLMLCVGLGSDADDLATELLVRILRYQKIDARHLSIDDLNTAPPPGASPGGVCAVYLVSAFPGEERRRGEDVAEKLRQRFPGARLITLFLPGVLLQPGSVMDGIRAADRAATSFGHAAQICLSMQQETT